MKTKNKGILKAEKCMTYVIENISSYEKSTTKLYVSCVALLFL